MLFQLSPRRSARRCLVNALALASVSLGVGSVAMPEVAAAQSPTSSPPITLTAEQASLDVRVLKRVLLALHPGLTKYLTEAEWQAALARFEARGNAARSPAEMFLAASELAAAIRCGHTWTNVRNQSGAVRAAIYEAPNKLPMTMTLVEGRWLVLGSATPELRRGDEVTHVNGVPAADMVARLWPYLRADGSSDGKRLRQLGHDRLDVSQLDVTWPFLSPPVDGYYTVGVQRAGRTTEARVAAVTLAARGAALTAQGITPPDETWGLTIERNAAGRPTHAVLRLPTFAFWNSQFDWQGFLSKAFAELNAGQVPRLIVDIRDNEGGDDAIGRALLAHLLKSPLRTVTDQAITSYERAPYVLVRYLDTWDYSFFDRTGKVRAVTEGPQVGKLEVIERVARTQVIEPVTNPYQGKVVMLVGGENSSATFILARLVQQSGVATLVGQPTGGNLRGLNGGELTWVTLPHSRVAVDVPLLAARYGADTPDRSVVPDVIVKRRFTAQRDGIDEEMQAALRVLSRPAR